MIFKIKNFTKMKDKTFKSWCTVNELRREIDKLGSILLPLEEKEGSEGLAYSFYLRAFPPSTAYYRTTPTDYHLSGEVLKKVTLILREEYERLKKIEDGIVIIIPSELEGGE